MFRTIHSDIFLPYHTSFCFWDGAFCYRWLQDGTARTSKARGVLTTTPGRTISPFATHEDNHHFYIPPSIHTSLIWGATLHNRMEVPPLTSETYNDWHNWNTGTRDDGIFHYYFFRNFYLCHTWAEPQAAKPPNWVKVVKYDLVKDLCRNQK